MVKELLGGGEEGQVSSYARDSGLRQSRSIAGRPVWGSSQLLAYQEAHVVKEGILGPEVICIPEGVFLSEVGQFGVPPQGMEFEFIREGSEEACPGEGGSIWVSLHGSESFALLGVFVGG